MNIISTQDALPKNKTYVLVHLSNPPWIDSDDSVGLKWVVAKFQQGISVEEREALLLDDPRKNRYTGADEDGNNLVPYNWNEFGPDCHFGQEVDYWCHLPTLP